MIRSLLTIGVCLALASCGRSSAPTGNAVSAPEVRLVSVEIQSGQATQSQLKEGMQSVAKEVSLAFADLRKTYLQLNGRLRGNLRIKPDGTVLSFTDMHSQFTPVLPPKAFADFVGGSFGPNCRFPVLGNTLVLTIDVQLEP